MRNRPPARRRGVWLGLACEISTRLRGSQGTREQISLGVWTIERAQMLRLLGRLDAFRNHTHPELPREIDDASNDWGVVVDAADAADEGLIDLQRVEAVPVQVTERRESCPEVVQIELHRNRPQVVEPLRDGV